MKISQIDKNFEIQTKISKKDIVFRSVRENPFSVRGIFHDDGKFRRMPKDVAKSVSEGVYYLHSNTAGGRVRFKTNSPYVAIHAKMANVGKMPHFALTGSSGFDLYVNNTYKATFIPPFEMTDGYEGVIELGSKKEREITINFPTYSDVLELYVGIGQKATLCAPNPYKIEKPVVFYGSSITQGGCTSRPGSTYEAILSREFDFDYVNLGFSGNARAEDEMIEYIKGLDMSVFVMDYDHNAPTVEHLLATHEKMFKAVREANPTLPIVLMSRPKYSPTKEEKSRLEIIKSTYNNAKASGDENVYMIDGKALMKVAGNEGTVDNCHPNDLGFYSMACAVKRVLRTIFGK